MTTQPPIDPAPDDTTKPDGPVNPEQSPPAPAPASPADEPRPQPSDYMTRTEFRAALDEWKAEQKAEAEAEAARRAPAPAPKPKPQPAQDDAEGSAKPTAPETPATTEEPGYGSRSWFNRKPKTKP